MHLGFQSMQVKHEFVVCNQTIPSWLDKMYTSLCESGMCKYINFVSSFQREHVNKGSIVPVAPVAWPGLHLILTIWPEFFLK